ncbi:hypothetical protein PBN151_0887 [Paenibacillus sp. NAIST15-1]|nr:hypothetical protein PBN151_0887 [Paenibacillus sp. NAIST15-1]
MSSGCFTTGGCTSEKCAHYPQEKFVYESVYVCAGSSTTTYYCTC